MKVKEDYSKLNFRHKEKISEMKLHFLQNL